MSEYESLGPVRRDERGRDDRGQQPPSSNRPKAPASEASQQRCKLVVTDPWRWAANIRRRSQEQSQQEAAVRITDYYIFSANMNNYDLKPAAVLNGSGMASTTGELPRAACAAACAHEDGRSAGLVARSLFRGGT